MTTQANNNKGTFSQLPTVFIDTCDLPDAQQMVFIRLWKETFNGVNDWQGSTRKLAKIARVSVGTAFSAKKILQAAGLVEVSPVPNEHNNADSFKINIKHKELWALNDLYCKGAKVEKWKVLPHVDSVQNLNRGVQSVTQGGVQKLNDNVQILNRGCSEIEQGQAQWCSNFEQGCSIDKLKSTPYIGTVDNIDPTYNRSYVDKGVNPPVVNDASIPTTPITEKELPLEATEEIAEPVQPPPSPEPTKPERPAGKRNRNVTFKETPPEPQQQKLEMPSLDAAQQAVYDEWCKMPWFRGIPPKITPAMPECLKKLAAYSLTADQMLECKKWATSSQVDKKGYYKNKGWSVFFLANEVPKWLSAQPEKPAETKQSAPEPASPGMLVLWTRNPSSPKFSMDASAWYFYEEMTLEEARQYDYDLYGGLPGDIQMRIKTQFDREQRGEIKRPELVA